MRCGNCIHRNSERNEMTKQALTVPILFLTGVMAWSSACAQQGGRITFLGAIVSSTCTVSTADQDKIVPMGAIDAREFAKVGDIRGRQRFSLQLQGCGAPGGDQPQRASVRFSGMDINPHSSNLHLMHAGQTGTASGVEVRILNASGEKLALAASPSEQRATVIDLRSGRNSMDFAADYVAVALPVVGGRADAAINFEISYP